MSLGAEPRGMLETAAKSTSASRFKVTGFDSTSGRVCNIECDVVLSEFLQS